MPVLPEPMSVSQPVYDFLRSGKLPEMINLLQQMATTTTPGAVILATNGQNMPGRVVQGNDARLSNPRTPTSHGSTHKTGGSDALKLDELAAPADGVLLDATPSLHGLMSKADKAKLDGLPASLGGTVHISATVPLPAFGADGDIALVLANRSTYYKSAGSWTFFGQDAKSVTDSQAVFVTPTAGDGSADLSTP
jgi:hypothetical protein